MSQRDGNTNAGLQIRSVLFETKTAEAKAAAAATHYVDCQLTQMQLIKDSHDTRCNFAIQYSVFQCTSLWGYTHTVIIIIILAAVVSHEIWYAGNDLLAENGSKYFNENTIQTKFTFKIALFTFCFFKFSFLLFVTL